MEDTSLDETIDTGCFNSEIDQYSVWLCQAEIEKKSWYILSSLYYFHQVVEVSLDRMHLVTCEHDLRNWVTMEELACVLL